MNVIKPVLTAAGTALLLSGVAAATSETASDLSFRVLLDGKPIGSHDFRITEQETEKVIESNASFDVSLFFVPVFSYRHSNTEVWRDGCLVQIDAETDANGKQFRVEGRKDTSAYRIGTNAGAAAYPADCLMSFAYWDRQMVQQNRLLNAQTGEIVEVDIEPQGQTILDLDGRNIAVDGYRIRAAAHDVDITVWYSRRDGRWVSLESRLKNGRLMRYLPADNRLLASAASDGRPEGR
jgi:hypothetical protein